MLHTLFSGPHLEAAGAFEVVCAAWPWWVISCGFLPLWLDIELPGHPLGRRCTGQIGIAIHF